jgi:hypothetical protein
MATPASGMLVNAPNESSSDTKLGDDVMYTPKPGVTNCDTLCKLVNTFA